MTRFGNGKNTLGWDKVWKNKSMNGKWRFGCWLILASLAATSDNFAWAQNQKQKPENPPKTEKTDLEEPAVPEDPAVAAILETKPATPSECIRAAKILSDLKRPDLAKQFLQKVIDAKLDTGALANLADRFGSAMFVQLSARADLRPQSQQVADAVLEAQNSQLQNPQRVAELIKLLQDSSAENRSAAFSGLMDARGAAVAAMIEALADPARAAEHLQIRNALAAMGRQAVDPLLGIIDQADVKLKIQAIAILGELKAPGLQLFLFKPYLSKNSDPAVRAAAGAALQKLGRTLPTKDQAIRLLTDNAKNYFNQRQIVPGIVEGKVEVWHWNEAQRQCEVTKVSADDAARALAVRLAGDAFSIAPEDTAVSQLYLAAILEAAAYQKGLSKPLDEKDDVAVAEAKQLGAKAIEGAMAYAIVNGHPAAAAAAAGILGQIGTPEELLYIGSHPGALALALRNPDRRLRFAAVQAIIALRPQRPFSGSSYVLQSLAYFASSSGMRRALLAGANVEDLRKMVSVLSAAGLHADTAVNGREVMRMAVSSPDYELAMIDMGIDKPPINLLLQQLRHDERSTDLRVGLIAREGFFDRAERVAEHDLLVKVFARPHDDASITWDLQQLAGLKPQEFVGFEERQRQAAVALDLLAELGRGSNKFYDMHQVENAVLTALNTPSLSLKAIAVLAEIDSPEAQRALVETAGRTMEPLETRLAAASAFRENIQANGILLTTEEIKKQYQRYNESKNQDAAAQKILGLILDCLEAPTKSGE